MPPGVFQIGSHRNRVCVLSTLDVEDFERTELKPDCSKHEHMSRHDAVTLTRELLYSYTQPGSDRQNNVYEARWVYDGNNKPFAITFHEPKHWVIRLSGGVMPTHQLVRRRFAVGGNSE